MMSVVNRNNKVMDHHLFTKKALAPLGHIRADVHRLLNIEQSMEYRLGKRLLGPVRRALARLHRGQNRGEPDSVREQLPSPTTQK